MMTTCFFGNFCDDLGNHPSSGLKSIGKKGIFFSLGSMGDTFLMTQILQANVVNNCNHDDYFEKLLITGKEMVDYIADYLENIRDRRVFPEVSLHTLELGSM